jgi:ribonuclease inhibitor
MKKNKKRDSNMNIVLDAEKLNDKETAHDYLAEVLSLPDYYGKNLDALYDCVSEMNIEMISIVNSNKGEFYYFKILEVFEDCGINIEYQ